jgi:low affinity Fe/Cu permease
MERTLPKFGDICGEQVTSRVAKTFARVASAIARGAGKPVTFLVCCVIVAIWAVSGPVFHFSDTWQLVINTGTTIVTFLMIFLIQNTQNRDGAAIQAKLDELILVGTAPNRYIGIEELTDEELEELREKCRERARELSEKVERAEVRAVT